MVTILETERTVVDRITLDDAPFFVELVNSPDWRRYIGERDISTTEEARQFLQQGLLKSYADNGFGYYLIRCRKTGTSIGIGGFLKKPTLSNPDLGFAFLKQYYGQGLASESCRAILEYGAHTFCFPALDAVANLDNARSHRLLERLGFQQHGTITPEGDEELALFRWYTAN